MAEPQGDGAAIEIGVGRREREWEWWEDVGGIVLVIDAKNDRVAAWYASYGAVPLLDASLSLLLPLATIEAALKHARK